MRLVRFNRVVEALNLARLGVVVGPDLVADLGLALRLLRADRASILDKVEIPSSIAMLLQMGDTGQALLNTLTPWLEETAVRASDLKGTNGALLFTPLIECRMHAPLRLTKFVVARGETSRPHFTMKPTTAVVGPVREVAWPAGGKDMHCAAGLAVVIGRSCRNVAEAEVPKVIAGYMVATDVTVRSMVLSDGVQSYDSVSFEAGMFEGFAPSGPHLVTPEEIGKVDELSVELKVNGQLRHRYSARDLTCSVAPLVSFLSRMTLEPGDVVWSGASGDKGTAVAIGDLVEASITGLGMIGNRIVESSPN